MFFAKFLEKYLYLYYEFLISEPRACSRSGATYLKLFHSNTSVTMFLLQPSMFNIISGMQVYFVVMSITLTSKHVLFSLFSKSVANIS